jgi:hypothetical protein
MRATSPPSGRPIRPFRSPSTSRRGCSATTTATSSAGLYADRETALLDALVEGWLHHRGRYSTLRVDIGLAGDNKAPPDTDDVDLEEAASAAEALRDNGA